MGYPAQPSKRALLEQYLHEHPSGTMLSAADGAIARRDERDLAPLSSEQLQRWHQARRAGNVPLYHECATLELPGLGDVVALSRSLNEMIRRHEILRTSFPMVNGQPIQQVLPMLTLALPLSDLRELPEPERESEALRLAAQNARQLFDIERGPLLRAMLIRMNDEAYSLYMTLHDLIADCISLYQVFLPELRALYEAFSRGQPSPLRPLPIQYADYAERQHEWLKGAALANQLAYWSEKLASAPAVLPIPTDRPRPPRQTHCGATYQFTVPRESMDALKELSRREHVTLYMTLLAAFATLLFRFTGQDDLVIGTVSSAGRIRPEVQGLMGWFINTLALRIQLASPQTFLDVLKRTKEVVLEAYAHQDASFELVAREVWPGFDRGDTSPLQVMFVLEPPPPVLQCGWTLSLMGDKTQTSKFELSLIVNDRAEGLFGRCEYNTDSFDDATIADIAEAWQCVLESAARDPTQRLADLQLPLPVGILSGTAAAVTDLAQGMSRLAVTGSETPSVAAESSRAAIQRQLLQIWEELLPVRPIGMGDNFFDLGGHSLLVARMLQRIGEECGKRIPLTTLFEGATIEQLADHILQSTPTDDSPSSLMAMNTSGHRTALFFLHGGGSGNGVWCANIGRALGPDQPFYGIPPLSFDDLPPSRMFEAMAHAHLKQVRTIQPQGPYRLGGYCNGGLLAYEMAQQLLAQGHEVELLLLLEPVTALPLHKLLYAWITTVGASLGLSASQQAATYIYLQILRTHVAQTIYHIVARRRMLAQQPEGGNRLQLVSTALSQLKAIPPSREEIRGDWFGWYSWAKAEYIPLRYYPGRLTVLWTAEEAKDELGAPSIATRTAQWHSMTTAQEMEMCIVPGTRLTCRTDHVRALAAHFVRCCRTVDGV